MFEKAASPEERAAELLSVMSLDEKIYQVTSDMYFDVENDYEKRRDPMCGSYRNPGHFLHYMHEKPATPGEVAKKINHDVEMSIKAQPHGIPPIENGEALHGAQWGMATCFPQPIAMASSFDPDMTERIADVIGKECNVVGVRQVFSPVINLVRDSRWGRTVESYGEDVKLCSDMGAAMCRGLERNGVIATPKHFADNYAEGGRDSNYSDNSERTLREVFLPPFKACFDAGAQSTMTAYNSWEGVPCAANRRLLDGILRKEWGFKGFTVSDYDGVESLVDPHRYASSYPEACAKALKAGLDNILPMNLHDDVKKALEEGLITEEELDMNVKRILEAKFRLGLFDGDVYRDPLEADRLVRCDEHRKLALEAARESIVLLKNNGVLPMNPRKIRKIGIFGQSADTIPVGANYSGPYRFPWTGEDAPTPFEAIKSYLGDGVEIVRGDCTDISGVASECDFNIYFTSLIEGEYADRSDLRLPSVSVHVTPKDGGGLVVENGEQIISENQEESIIRMFEANPNSAVVLLNGSSVDMSAWIDKAGAVLEAWYPGEQGAKAIAEILFGETNPSAKLPICFPKHAGQMPLHYSYKPSGRGYNYVTDDGRPLYTFGYGLSYTEFEIENAGIRIENEKVTVSFDIKNSGKYDGAEVVQLYLGSYYCDVVRPLKELKAYRRINLKKGQKTYSELAITAEDLKYYDSELVFGLHDGTHKLMLGTSSDDIRAEFEIKVKNGRIFCL